MTKKYFSKSCLSINVVLGSGKSRHISFEALTGGGSVYYTDSVEMQQALKRHRQYGQAFREVAMPQEAAPAVPQESQGSGTAGSGTVVRVKDLTEAKDYLGEHYGVSRTKMKGEEGVRKAAARCGVTLEIG